MSYIAGCRINLGEAGIKERGDSVSAAELKAAEQGEEEIANLVRDGALLKKEEYEKEEA